MRKVAMKNPDRKPPKCPNTSTVEKPLTIFPDENDMINDIKRTKITSIIRQQRISGDLSSAFQFTTTIANYNHYKQNFYYNC